MQNKNKSIKSEFKDFLDSVSHLTNGSRFSNLLSFSFKIPDIEIPRLINSNILRNQDLFYWKIKYEGIEFLAFNPLININEYGEKRLTKTCEKVNALEKEFISNWEENNLEFVPLIVGGIKFAPDQHSELWKEFSDSDWFIPKVLIFKKDRSLFMIYNFFKEHESARSIIEFEKVLEMISTFYDEGNNKNHQPNFISLPSTNSFGQWKKIVDEALFNISEGLLTKVVLSREVNFQINQETNLYSLIHLLSERYPNCYTFAFKRGNSIFLGASPEKLAKISNNWIEVDALAGSVPRGKDESEDIEMERFLLSSEKNLFEQRAVVNFIHNLLNKFSDEIVYDDKPRIRKLPNIQHLWTTIRAKLHSDFNILDLLMKLHPTPAICGAPWKIAKDFILEMEPHDRGLYSGNIGWFNFNSSAEFAVGIRTALLKENDLFAYAGCGIVEGSEARAEYEESEIKLKPILSLFIDEKVYQP